MSSRVASFVGSIQRVVPRLALSATLAAGAVPVAAQAGGVRKAVLVTGASSGIGLNVTKRLAGKGYYVYAGARTDEDLKALDAIPNVKGVRLDVTKPDQIAAAVELVRQGGRGLHGVVNNAGVAVLAPLIETDDEDLNFQLDVNVLGPHRITRAFAPMLIESKGRVTTIGSINGIIAGPFSGSYAMTKHAVEAYTDALAQEMAAFGVKVSVVEPGRFRSSMSANVFRRWRERNRSVEGSRFEAQYRQLLAAMDPKNESRYPEPDLVSDAVEHAMFDPDPKLRYLVAPSAAAVRATIRRSLERAVELNERQQFSLDRAALVALLDSVLARKSSAP
jgi:NAD(P)-dependent dehydrogenase (short-subunit alcohol dehydrogenase family)